jgi:hypothetical protein
MSLYLAGPFSMSANQTDVDVRVGLPKAHTDIYRHATMHNATLNGPQLLILTNSIVF